uniref:Uncharacterized protein n=1 Tax=Helianthus annuus TaxID=4232 RepID=A0A251VMI8_HELAN
MPAVEQAARRWWFLRVSQSILMKASYLGCLIADLKHYCIHPDSKGIIDGMVVFSVSRRRIDGMVVFCQQEDNRWNGGLLTGRL